MSDLSLCLGVLKHRAPLARGEGWQGSSSCQHIFFAMDFCLSGAILNLKAFCLGAIPDIMMEFDSHEYVCLTTCVDLPGLPPSEPK